MRKINIVSTATEYERSELSREDADLLESAAKSSSDAYAPYSGFRVGAALRLENGQIVTGNNQENAAYPSGMCAERVAVFHAGAIYPDVPVNTIAITCRSEKMVMKTPLSPCGACRQVISEYEKRWNRKIRILLTGESGPVLLVESMADLLPLSFEAEDLKIK